MDKRVNLKLHNERHNGSIDTGFAAILQIGDEGKLPEVEISGSLPAAPALKSLYHQWQASYRHLDMISRIEAKREGFATNVSIIGDCHSLAAQLAHSFNQWLRSEAFRPIQEKLLEQLAPQETIRLILQTPYGIVQQLPWHLWEICDRYPHLEITLSAPTYQKTAAPPRAAREKIRILAVIGHSQGIDIQTDQDLLNRLPNTEIKFLTQPDRPTLDAHLWDPKGWDILFFAGHSLTKPSPTQPSVTLCSTPAVTQAAQIQPQNAPQSTPVGYLYLNKTDFLTIEQLKNALRNALTHGLKMAIFNSCDGLGLAQALADLQISQVVVMREPVPDQIAHAFLKSFLPAFSQGLSLTLAIREAREKLQGLESQYPCAAWLPVLYQNPAEVPPTWQSLLSARAIAPPPAPRPRTTASSFWWVHALTLIALLGLRYLGFFQPLEAHALDQFMRLRAKELPDDRIVIVTVNNANVEAQDPETRRGSLADADLMAALDRLNTMKPRLIGLDIYRDYPARADQPALAKALKQQDNLFGVCKGSDQAQTDGISPPAEIPEGRVGFSDFLKDADGIVRRQLYSLEQEPTSPCQSAYALSMLLAMNYLATEGFVATAAAGENASEKAGKEATAGLTIGKTLLQPLKASDGGYRTIDAKGYQLLLNYRSLERPEQIAEQVTLTQLLKGEVSPAVIRDRIVLIGTKTTGFYEDNWNTPYGETRGVFMQAHMMSQILSAVLDDRPLLRYWPEWSESLWILFWAGTGSLLALSLPSGNRHGLRKLALGLLASELALLGLCWLLFSQAALWVPWVPAAIAPLLVAASTALHPSAGQSTGQSTGQLAGANQQANQISSKGHS
jgi:CHASE2 domain-containing sensor protein